MIRVDLRSWRRDAARRVAMTDDDLDNHVRFNSMCRDLGVAERVARERGACCLSCYTADLSEADEDAFYAEVTAGLPEPRWSPPWRTA